MGRDDESRRVRDGCLSGGFPLDSIFGLAQGFDTYDDYYGSGATGLQLDERTADRVVASAMEWLNQQAGSWFAWVHVYDPHAPYSAPAPYGARYAESPYEGEVAYTDAMLAPLIEFAEARDAVIVVTSDHGEALGEHGEATHGVFVYDATLRVPLILAGIDGVEAGTEIAERVRHIDVLPTVLEAVGLRPGPMQGVSLGSVIAGGAHPDSESYFEALTPFLDWGWAPLRGIYADQWKYIELPIPELFDLAGAGEAENLAEIRNTDLARMAGLLSDHLASAPEQNAAAEETPETLRRLRALGYVGNTTPGQRSVEDFGPEDDPKRLIEIEGMIQTAVAALDARDFPGASATLQEILARRPTMARAYTLYARAVEAQAGPAAAAAVLEDAMGRGVVTAHLLGRLAFFLSQSGRLDEAVTAAEQALEQQADDVETLALLATIHAQGGRPADAERLLLRALELDPTFARPHGNLGTLYLQTGRRREAAEAFQTALEYDPGLIEAHNGLGVMAADAGNYTVAVQHWEQVIRVAPNSPFTLFNLAAVHLEETGRFQDGLAAIEQYLRLRPNDQRAQALRDELRARTQ